jgi:hypothetical protein
MQHGARRALMSGPQLMAEIDAIAPAFVGARWPANGFFQR